MQVMLKIKTTYFTDSRFISQSPLANIILLEITTHKTKVSQNCLGKTPSNLSSYHWMPVVPVVLDLEHSQKF